MDWKSARAGLSQLEVAKASGWSNTQCKEENFENLYRKTGCAPPRHRYVEFEGRRYPAKAFGYLVLMEAGWDHMDGYRPTVNEVVSPLRKFGVRDIR